MTARPMGRGVEVGHARGGDVKGAALQRGEAFATSCARQSMRRALSAPYSSALRGISS